MNKKGVTSYLEMSYQNPHVRCNLITPEQVEIVFIILLNVSSLSLGHVSDIMERNHS